MPITKNGRGFTAGKFALQIGSSNAGWVQSVEGGNAVSDVIVEKIGADNLQHKHIGGVKYEDITINCGTGMSKGFYEWMKKSFDRSHMRNDGAIHTCDYDGSIVSTLQFFQGLISEIGFPACDAASKDAAKMSIKVAPEFTRHQNGDGKKVDPSGFSIKPEAQKKWVPANFRLSIAGCEQACKKVNKIEALTLKQKIVENPIGEGRDYEKEPANLEVPNLVITMAESHADEFYNWHKSFVIDGKNDPSQEKTGSLEYLTPDFQTLFTLNFMALGIFKLSPEKVEAGSENIRRVKAEMYCENITFNYAGGATWA
jgi:phage tail-like protein